MCGIIGYIGYSKNVKNILLEGLSKLEYRGYDSVGIVIQNDYKKFEVYKTIDGIDSLRNMIPSSENNLNLQIAIGHTRWATHGCPSIENAHPHWSNDKSIYIVHNGIIENYKVLKQVLEENGYIFYSETDTEVLVNWIHFYFVKYKSLTQAIIKSLEQVVGAYSILVTLLDTQEIVICRKSSPVIIGIGENEYTITSDSIVLGSDTKKIFTLKDNELVTISFTENNLKFNVIKISTGLSISPFFESNDSILENIEKGSYDSFMLKEIEEQPKTIEDTMKGRIMTSYDDVKLSIHIPYIIYASRIFIIACGTSWHAALIGKYIIEKITRIPIIVDYSSEFRYNNPIIKRNDIVISISQSGETADTKSAMTMAKDKGARLISIVNRIGSSISQLAECGIYTHSGIEIGVASTKSFTGQLVALIMLSLKIALFNNTMSKEDFYDFRRDLLLIPQKIQTILDQTNNIFKIADIYSLPEYKNFLYLGRGINYPIALEGALKLKEVSYIHAEGYPAGEIKHGPIALVDENCPSIFIAPSDSSYDKILNNMYEIKARKGKVVAIITEGDMVIPKIVDHYIEIPETNVLLTPLLTIIPLQLIAYKIAINLGRNVDKPRNLAKSVTVE